MKEQNLYRWILFFINPFFSMVIVFFENRMNYSKNLLWAFCTFYGLTFAIGEESSSNDIVRYVGELEYFHSLINFSWNDLLLYFVSSGEVDVVRTLLNYGISRFTDSQAVLTTVFGLIFGYFYSRNIAYVFSMIKHKLGNLEKLLLFTLILIVPIWFINGFRMWTAFHVFMFGLLPFIFEKRKGKLVFLFLSMLVHFSFLLPIGVFLIYFFFGARIKVFFAIFLISIFFNNINIDIVNDFFAQYMPEVIDRRSESYRSESRIEIRNINLQNDTRNWYVIWNGRVLNWSLMAILIYLFLFANNSIKTIPLWKRLLSITFLFFSISNLMSQLPSGGRYATFSYFLAILCIVMYLNSFKVDLKSKRIVELFIPAFVLFIIVSVRIGLYSTSVSTIFGNPIIGIFTSGENLSLNDLIK